VVRAPMDNTSPFVGVHQEEPKVAVK
jgi:hypothetical protein